MHGAAIRFCNYAFYTAAIAAGAFATDLPHPSNYSAGGERVLYTLIGIAIAVLVKLLGTPLDKRRPKTSLVPATDARSSMGARQPATN